jgi:hypothetical protein
MHRRKDLWGPDGKPFPVQVVCTDVTPAEEFDPDRFIDERLHKYLIPTPFIFLPFNAGPRICLGQQVISCVSSSSIRWSDHTIVRLQRNVLHAYSPPPSVLFCDPRP